MKQSRMEIRIGARVMTTDGSVGHVQRVIVDPQKSQTFALVVRPRPLAGRATLIPFEYVADACDREVRLKICRTEIDSLQKSIPSPHDELVGQPQDYVERGAHDSAAPPTLSKSEISQGETKPGPRVQLGQQVRANGKTVGEVSHVLVNSQGRVTAFVLRRPLLTGRSVIVPSEFVHGVDHLGVHLTLEPGDLDTLVEYSIDQEISTHVVHALWGDHVLGKTIFKDISVEVEDGIATLMGHVATAMIKARVEQLVKSIRSVLDVKNLLISDDELEVIVAQSIAGPCPGRETSIYVHANYGWIYLSGKVSDPQVRQIATKSAASIPQVRGVFNDIQIPGLVINEGGHSIIQPRIGDRVFATDMQLGSVERVILNPRNRLVSAIALRGRFPDLKLTEPGMRVYEMALINRLVLIPSDDLHHAAEGQALLRISALESASYAEFDPTCYVIPGKDWEPPYPYRASEVLLETV